MIATTPVSAKLQTLVADLEKALSTYSNVHRGSGHASMITSALYDKSRKVVLDFLKLPPKTHTVIFCSPRRFGEMKKQLPSVDYKRISSQQLGLPIGMVALAIRKRNLANLQPVDVGGGTAKLTSTEWVVNADKPGLFEAGTPAIINVIVFARTLQLKISPESVNGEGISIPQLFYSDAYENLEGKALLEKLRTTIIGADLKVKTQ